MVTFKIGCVMSGSGAREKIMSWRLIQAASAAVLAFSFCFNGSAIAGDAMGSVVAVQGRPTAAGPDGSRALSAGSDVFEGDTVTVGDGNAQLLLDDGTKLVVGPSSRLLIQAYLRRSGSTASKVSVKALRGTFRFITGKSPKSAYNINTSNATIGIRGTGFDFRVNNRTLLAVLEGAVRLRGRNGQAVNLKSGCGIGEAGPDSTKARVLSGEAKSKALQNELPFTIDQSSLGKSFHLPIKDCLIYLGSNETPAPPPGLTPQQFLPLIPALAVPAVIIATSKNKSRSVSPETVRPDPTPSPCVPPTNDPNFCD
jgi:FecR protein